jgi:hypothetical protein
LPVTAPIVLTVKRYKCPHCPRARAKKSATVAHIGRCWNNPDVRACRTCANFDPNPCCGMPDLYQCYTPMCPTPSCAAGVELPEGGAMVTGCPAWKATDL